ncbi:uncharacterized protein V2V93DRAFT_362681 [Kockiozyma suomiensis]|uniref:uncharacterized protein n=1 Tax=Kockiozyma suomiensis TaxID=1337062 RepID=UPI00334302D1
MIPQPRRRSLRNIHPNSHYVKEEHYTYANPDISLSHEVASCYEQFSGHYTSPTYSAPGDRRAMWTDSSDQKYTSATREEELDGSEDVVEDEDEDEEEEDDDNFDDNDFMSIEDKMAQTKKGLYRCSHCPQKFATMYLFWEHIKHKNLPRPYKCTKASCPWSLVGFPNRNECSRHVKHQHDQARGFSCVYSWCLKKFHRKDSRNRHIKLVHQKPDSRLNRKLDKKRKEEEARERRRAEGTKGRRSLKTRNKR